RRVLRWAAKASLSGGRAPRRGRCACCSPGPLFVSAGLLFLLQPMIARMVLPKFGGSSGVWNTCMVFFQSVLLAGYGYAHLVAVRLPVRRQAALQLLLLLVPLAVLPIAVAEGWAPPGDADPVAPLVGLLALSAGLPFFALSTNAPLL